MKSLVVTFACLAVAMAVPGFAQTSAHSATLRATVNRGYLGVGVEELTDDRVKALNLKDDQGLEVSRIDGNSPAARAGLRVNDVILEVNGKGIEGGEQFSSLIGEMSPGTKVSLTIWRNGAKQTLSATLDSRPVSFFLFGGPDLPTPPVPPMPQVPLSGAAPFPASPANSPMVGFEGAALNSQIAAFFGVKEGVLVWSVTAKTPAERAGLKAGDVVVKVNGTPVTTTREITGLVRASRKGAISFTVVRNKKEISLNVEVAEDRLTPPDREVL